MSKNFKAKVNNSIDFDISTDDIADLDIVKISHSNYHLLHNNKSFHSKVVFSNFNKKQYQVSVNNTVYNVAIANDLDIQIKDMGFFNGSKKDITSIIAPMPGLILEINVEVGQEIQENDPLLILEAMKMENIITAPINGVIKAIHPNKGDAVIKNQLIIEFE